MSVYEPTQPVCSLQRCSNVSRRCLLLALVRHEYQELHQATSKHVKLFVNAFRMFKCWVYVYSSECVKSFKTGWTGLGMGVNLQYSYQEVVQSARPQASSRKATLGCLYTSDNVVGLLRKTQACRFEIGSVRLR